MHAEWGQDDHSWLQLGVGHSSQACNYHFRGITTREETTRQRNLHTSLAGPAGSVLSSEVPSLKYGHFCNEKLPAGPSTYVQAPNKVWRPL